MGIKRYNTVAVIIHWIMAILLICMFILGIYMVKKGNKGIQNE